MKCVKIVKRDGNLSMEEIIRVRDSEAKELVAKGAKYVTKAEWKQSGRNYK